MKFNEQEMTSHKFKSNGARDKAPHFKSFLHSILEESDKKDISGNHVTYGNRGSKNFAICH